MIEYLADLTQIVVGIGGLSLAIYTLVKNRDLIFKNSLRNRQLEEMCHLREKLFNIWFSLYYVKIWAAELESLGRSISEFEKEQPEDWQMFREYQKDSREVFYKFHMRGYYLFPKWLEHDEVADLPEMMKEFAPFTLSSHIHADPELTKGYPELLLKKIEYFDSILKKRS